MDAPRKEIRGPIDLVDHSFPLMDLPPEIRLEIYRACLTRPWSIPMSRRPKQPAKESKLDDLDAQPDTQHDTDPLHWPTDGARRRRRRSRRPPTRHDSPSSDDSNASDTSSASTSSTTSASTAAAAAAKPPSQDPLILNLLLVSREVHREARAALYSDNKFTLDLGTAAATLAGLHQHTRRLIRHVELEIPGFSDICEPFGNAVRLGLRYCSALRMLVVYIPFSLPYVEPGGNRTRPPQANSASMSSLSTATTTTTGQSTAGSTTTIIGKSSQGSVYTHGFDTLRWLPQGCDIVLTGKANPDISTAVREHLAFARTLNKVAYARRQIMSHESHGLVPSSRGLR